MFTVYVLFLEKIIFMKPMKIIVFVISLLDEHMNCYNLRLLLININKIHFNSNIFCFWIKNKCFYMFKYAWFKIIIELRFVMFCWGDSFY